MILVIGASGSVGRLMVPHWHLLRAPVALQWRNGKSVDYALPNLRWDPNDGPNKLVSWIETFGYPIQAMLILAGVTPRSRRDLNLNSKIVETCLHASQAIGLKRVLIASSSSVYGDHLNRPFTETDTPIPVNDYGLAKLEMEKACATWSKTMEIVFLRIGNVVGADALLRQPVSSANSEILLDYFSDGGTPERSYIGPGTMAKALVDLALLTQPLPPILNFAAPAPVKMGALLNSAGLAWRKVVRNDTKGKSITLDCSLLWTLLPAPPLASDPADMTSQLSFLG